MEATTTGARVGVASNLGGKGKMAPATYMAMWDKPEGRLGIQRPWLSQFAERYAAETRRIILREMKMKLGAK